MGKELECYLQKGMGAVGSRGVDFWRELNFGKDLGEKVLS